LANENEVEEKMRKICQKRSLAWILSFLLVFTSVPYEAFASENDKAANALEGESEERKTDEGNDEQIESPAPENEIVEERTENAKVFDNGDGTFTKNIYFDPIHIEENGEFTEVSTDLSETTLGDQKVIETENTLLSSIFYEEMMENMPFLKGTKRPSPFLSWKLREKIKTSK
jgi:hypothetical protein